MCFNYLFRETTLAMTDSFPSIFNDVIGPIMRGPSSSHCAAAVRIGRMARDLMNGSIRRVLIEFDSRGSLASTHSSQGSDMGLFAGLLGWDSQDERLPDAAAALEQEKIHVELRVGDYHDVHPNTYRLTLWNQLETHSLIALSTGGGMIEIVEIDGIHLSIRGDYVATLIAIDTIDKETFPKVKDTLAAEEILLHAGKEKSLLEIRSHEPLRDQLKSGGLWMRTLAPVLPVLSRRKMQLPFTSVAQMLEWNRHHELDLSGIALAYESARGGITENEVYDKMKSIAIILRRSIDQGLQGTKFKDRILGVQSAAFKTAIENGNLLDAGMLNTMILYVTSLMEVKSSMGIIVAAPTAGSCGGLPGAVIAAADVMGCSDDHISRAMLAAGMIGVFICAQSTFAAEVCGCLAECGSGSGMAAAALVTLAGGSARQAVDAASMAIQNVLGMVCDPVANRVEVPCLGRNVLAASNALACANMALAGYNAVIPLDEVIETMDRVGKSLPVELRCTAMGGLSITPTSKAIENTLRNHSRQN